MTTHTRTRPVSAGFEVVGTSRNPRAGRRGSPARPGRRGGDARPWRRPAVVPVHRCRAAPARRV